MIGCIFMNLLHAWSYEMMHPDAVYIFNIIDKEMHLFPQFEIFNRKYESTSFYSSGKRFQIFGPV